MNAWLKAHGYGITIHGLRHSFASQLAAAGASEAEIRDLLGHTSIEITRLYTHVRDFQKRTHVLSLGQNPALPLPPVRSAFAPVADPPHSVSTSPR
jgi:site-specific recombinase XerC